MTPASGARSRLAGALVLAMPVSLLAGALAAWSWTRHPLPAARVAALGVVLLASSGAAVSASARSRLEATGLRALVGFGSGLAVLWGALLSGGPEFPRAGDVLVASILVLLVPTWRAAVTAPLPITRETA